MKFFEWLKRVMSQLAQSPDPAQNGIFLTKDSVLKILKTDTFDIPLTPAPAAGSSNIDITAIDTGFHTENVPMVLVFLTNAGNTFSGPLPFYTFRDHTTPNGYLVAQRIEFSVYANVATANLPNSTNVQIIVTSSNRDEFDDLGPYTLRYYILEQTIG